MPLCGGRAGHFSRESDVEVKAGREGGTDERLGMASSSHASSKPSGAPASWLAPLSENPFAPALARSTGGSAKPAAADAAQSSAKRMLSKPSPKPQVSSKAPAVAAPRGESSGSQKKQPGVESCAEDKRDSETAEMSAEDKRTSKLVAHWEAQFKKMEEARERKRKLQALRKEREESDPCTCGHARARRLPKPLAAGGPRCPRCTPLPETTQDLPPTSAKKKTRGGKAAGEAMAVREAPIFYPTEEEFLDPMAYIRSIQQHAYDFGIFRIQPPP